MNPHLLRHLWALVEASQSQALLSYDDSSLVGWLTDQLSDNPSLDPAEVDCLSQYIYARVPLIRDLATHR